MPRLQLVSLAGTKFDDNVYEILLPTMNGEIGVLRDHMPLVSVAVRGAIVVRRQASNSDEQLEYVAISGGVISVEQDVVRVLVDEADLASDINVAEAQAAYERALTLKQQAKDQISLEHAKDLIDRSAVQLHVADLKRRHRRGGVL